MRSLVRPRGTGLGVAAILVVALSVGNAGTVDAKRPPKPSPSPTPTIQISIAPSGMLEPSREYANVDVTVTCPDGWTLSYGRLYVLRGDLGGAGTFSVSCTGTAQVAKALVVNGNRFELGDWTATAYVGIERSGQQVTATSTRTIRLEPTVTAQVAEQGQLSGSGGASIAITVACPIGTTGLASHVTLSQAGGTTQGGAPFTPICDGQDRTYVLSVNVSRGAFVTGSAVADAFVITEWNGQGFYGFDSRTITLLESSTGDTTPPTAPTGLNANVFQDGETWLSWGASSDNATPPDQIVYEVFLNGRFDQGIGGGLTRAILYADLGIVNTIEVIAVDGAGNRSAPSSVTVDCSNSWGCQ
jgi:hypothetical protein